jgi:hypothetical protein
MGNELFKSVTGATGLPEDLISEELNKLLITKGIQRSEVTLDELRDALAGYLREVIVGAKDEFESGVWIEDEVHPEDLGKED